MAICDEVETGDAEVIVVAFGSVARSAQRAVKEARARGIKAGLIRPATIWPFPEHVIRKYAGKARAFLVPEMNFGQLVLEVERVAGGKSAVHPYNRVDSEIITPTEILNAIKEV